MVTRTAALEEPGYASFAAATRGSVEEFKVYKELERRGLTPGVDFQFGADRAGGLSNIGNAKIQFFVPIARVALRVQGEFWATRPRAARLNDLLQKLFWEGRGWFVADLLAQEIEQNVRRVVGLALTHRNTPAAEAALK